MVRARLGQLDVLRFGRAVERAEKRAELRRRRVPPPAVGDEAESESDDHQGRSDAL